VGLLAALQFLTLLPIKRNFTLEQIGQATVFFPVVGIIIGGILVGLNYLLSLILPPSLVNALLVAALAVITGGLHLDGLADTLDGVGGQHTVEERLEIMKDSRIGGFGAIGIAVVLLLQYAALNNIPSELKMYTLLLTPTLSRWAMVNAIYVYPYARPSGMGKILKKGLLGLHYALDTVLGLMVAVILFRLGGLVIMAAAWATADLTALYLKSKLKGLTGDTYGTINEMVTLAVLIIINILAFKHWLII
jgi:adenosylcobinamide-GDP ribazoletransferase